MSFVKGLRCRECGREYPATLRSGCEDCFAPLEVDYHYDAIAEVLKRESFASARHWPFDRRNPARAYRSIGSRARC